MTEIDARRATTTPPPLRPRARYLALAVICLAELLVFLDNTLVNVALPAMGVQLQAGTGGLQWIIDAYTVAFSGLLLAFGHLGDRFGRRRLMIIGLAGVAVMSAVGALSTGLGMVILARAGMGIFAAAVFPATLAAVINLFTDARERAAAIAAWTAVAGLAVAIGPVTSGWLLEYFSWHSVFWINIPVAALGIAGLLLAVPETRAEHVGPLDYLGILLSLAGVTVLVWTIIEAPRHGWLAPVSIGGYLVAAALLAGFVLRSLRVESPVLDIRLFRIKRFSIPALAICVGYFSIFGFLFLITQYFQGVREYSALEFGIHSLPFAAAVAIGAPTATLLAQRIGTTAVVVAGLLVLACGMFVAGRVQVDSAYVGPVLASMLLLGAGFAIVQGPSTESIMSAVSVDEAGAGSAVNDTTREVGGALGVAVLGSVMTSVYTDRVSPLVDAVPDTVMNAQQKGFANQTVISVIEIAKAPTSPLLAQPKADLIYAMKTAALQGTQLATHITVVALVLCALAVAVLLPWRPHAASSPLRPGSPDAP